MPAAIAPVTSARRSEVTWRIIHPGTVVGSDGFGYDIQRNGTHYKIRRSGKVVLETMSSWGLA